MLFPSFDVLVRERVGLFESERNLRLLLLKGPFEMSKVVVSVID